MTVADLGGTMILTRRTLLVSLAPLLIVAALFLFIAAVNWEYEAKFFQPVMIHDHLDTWMGLKLLLAGVGFGFASSIFILLAFRHLANDGNWRWVLCSAALFVSLICFLMSAGFVVLGPAALTLMEQLNSNHP